MQLNDYMRWLAIFCTIKERSVEHCRLSSDWGSEEHIQRILHQSSNLCRKSKVKIGAAVDGRIENWRNWNKLKKGRPPPPPPPIPRPPPPRHWRKVSVKFLFNFPCPPSVPLKFYCWTPIKQKKSTHQLLWPPMSDEKWSLSQQGQKWPHVSHEKWPISEAVSVCLCVTFCGSVYRWKLNLSIPIRAECLRRESRRWENHQMYPLKLH